MAKFPPGVSGNPAGKKPGTLNKRTQLVKLLELHAESLIGKLVERAMQGDSTALKLAIERLIPRPKQDDSIIFELPDGELDSAANMMKIADEITKAVAAGSLTVDEAKKFADFINQQRLTIEDAKEKIEYE